MVIVLMLNIIIRLVFTICLTPLFGHFKLDYQDLAKAELYIGFGFFLPSSGIAFCVRIVGTVT